MNMVLPGLAYVRRPQVVEFFRKYLLDDYPPPRGKQSLAPYGAYHLAQMLRGFPIVKYRPRPYSHEDIRLCREWMAAQEAFVILGMSSNPLF